MVPCNLPATCPGCISCSPPYHHMRTYTILYLSMNCFSPSKGRDTATDWPILVDKEWFSCWFGWLSVASQSTYQAEETTTTVHNSSLLKLPHCLLISEPTLREWTWPGKTRVCKAHTIQQGRVLIIDSLKAISGGSCCRWGAVKQAACVTRINYVCWSFGNLLLVGEEIDGPKKTVRPVCTVYVMCHVYGRVCFPYRKKPQSGLNVRKCCVSLKSDSQSDEWNKGRDVIQGCTWWGIVLSVNADSPVHLSHLSWENLEKQSTHIHMHTCTAQQIQVKFHVWL